jgi:class 3 adenylate cyclase/predicted ATPase
VRNIAEWLDSLGLSEYKARFAENDIDLTVLPDLTDQDLRELGLSLGHRRKVLRAISDLSQQARATPPPAPLSYLGGAERRQLTVMFCDLVNSTVLSVRLDPERLHDVMLQYHRRCGEVIVRYGGFVAAYAGDGVMAFFGYPHAHEDDVERAARGALALVDAVATLDDGAGAALRARVAISTGLVVIGDSPAEGSAQEPEVVGEAPNLAARLQAFAKPGTVIIDSTTRRLLGELFEYDDLGTLSLKGFDERVPVWQIIRPSAIDSRFEALRATFAPLVGRDDEVNFLNQRWEEARSGNGCVVLISGEAGIGKSRIAQTILEQVTTELHTVVRLFCSPHYQNTALYPNITQLERAAEFRREDTAEQRLDKLEALIMEATPSDLREVAPVFASLLSIPTGDRYPPLNLSPQKLKEMTLKKLVAQVDGLAARRPVLIVIEDAHWSDPTSRELFDLLIDHLPRLPVLVIITSRPGFDPPWIGRPQVASVSLNRLPVRHRAEMISHLTKGKKLPEEFAEQIIDRTDGVPLYIEELTKAVLESGFLRDAGDRYRLSGPALALAIPASLNASLLARFDRLGPAREVAQIAAALGRQFPHELISAVARRSQQQLDDALSQLLGSGLIFRHGTPPYAEYTFKHALVQDAIYGTLLRSRRQQLHSQISATLESRFPELVETRPELLARHWTEAGSAEKAVAYWLKAGQQAMTRWAMTEAAAQARKGLELVAGLADSTARLEQELELQLTLGHALLATKGYGAPEPHAAYVRARQLCVELNRTPQLQRILVGQYLYCAMRGDLPQAELHAAEICDLAEADGDRMWKFTGSNLSGIICQYLGKFTDSRAHLERAIPLWDPRFRAFAASPADGYVSALIHLSRTLLSLGYLDQARARQDEAVGEARRVSPYTLAFALCNASHNDWAIGGARSANLIVRSADEVIAVSTEHNFPGLLGIAKIVRGWCLAAIGQTEEGIALILGGLETFRATGGNLLLPYYLVTLAEVYGWASQPGEALRCLEDAAQLVHATQERWIEAELNRIRGTVLVSMREHAAAEESYLDAIAVAQGQGAKFWELRSAIDLSRLWCDQGKKTDARELLSSVCAWFAGAGDSPWLEEAKTFLSRLG